MDVGKQGVGATVGPVGLLGLAAVEEQVGHRDQRGGGLDIERRVEAMTMLLRDALHIRGNVHHHRAVQWKGGADEQDAAVGAVKFFDIKVRMPILPHQILDRQVGRGPQRQPVQGPHCVDRGSVGAGEGQKPQRVSDEEADVKKAISHDPHPREFADPLSDLAQRGTDLSVITRHRGEGRPLIRRNQVQHLLGLGQRLRRRLAAGGFQIARDAVGEGGVVTGTVADVGYRGQEPVALEPRQPVDQFAEVLALVKGERNRDLARAPWPQAQAGAGDDAEVALKKEPVEDRSESVWVQMRQRRVFPKTTKPGLQDLAGPGDDLEPKQVLAARPEVADTAIQGTADQACLVTRSSDVESERWAALTEEGVELTLGDAWLNNSDRVVQRDGVGVADAVHAAEINDAIILTYRRSGTIAPIVSFGYRVERVTVAACSRDDSLHVVAADRFLRRLECVGARAGRHDTGRLLVLRRCGGPVTRI